MDNHQLKYSASVLSPVVLWHTSVLASSYDRVVTAEDLDGEKIYSPYAGREPTRKWVYFLGISNSKVKEGEQ